MTARTETIEWFDVAEKLPDDDKTVLIFGAAIVGVWLGYYEAGQWYLADAMPIEGTLSHWAHMPEGVGLRPTAQKCGSKPVRGTSGPAEPERQEGDELLDWSVGNGGE